MNILRNATSFFVLFLIGGLISACNVIHQNSRVPGISYITRVGYPPADTIIWSPKDPEKILVNTSQIGYGHAQVYILDIRTKERNLLAETENGDIWSYAWSPDGKKIVLSVSGATKGFSKYGLWLVNTENNSVEYLAEKFGATVWLPDNTLAVLAVDLASEKNPRRISISLINTLTKEFELIYSNEEAITYLGFSSSPDGRYLVFSLNSSYNSMVSDLYILDLQSRKVNQLTHDGISSFPQWSPKGDMIAYNKSNTSSYKTIDSIHIVRPDGSCDVEVPNVDYALSPTWSPDGRKIAFIGKDGIYVLNTDVALGRDIYQNICPE